MAAYKNTSYFLSANTVACFQIICSNVYNILRILPLRSLIVSSDMGKLEKAPSFCSTGISYQVKGHRKKSVTLPLQVNTETKEPILTYLSQSTQKTQKPYE